MAEVMAVQAFDDVLALIGAVVARFEEESDEWGEDAGKAGWDDDDDDDEWDEDDEEWDEDDEEWEDEEDEDWEEGDSWSEGDDE